MFLKNSTLFVILTLSSLLCMVGAAQAQLLPKTDFGYQRIVLQAGGFSARQGQAQDIDLLGLTRTHFNVTEDQNQNAFIGIGYYLEARTFCRGSLLFGVNVFYFAPTKVAGMIVGPQSLNNYSYQYTIANIPFLASMKGLVKLADPGYFLTLDGGAGFNLMRATSYSQKSLNGSNFFPTHPFSAHTQATFGAMLGIGMQFNDLVPCVPIELGYRFFYFGDGFLSKNGIVINRLATGKNYANALMVTVSIL